METLQLDRFTGRNENSVHVAPRPEPDSGPWRADARQRNTEPTSQGRTSSRDIKGVSPWLVRRYLHLRHGWMAVFAVLMIVGAVRGAAAQVPAPTPGAANDGDKDFEVSVFTGFSIDSFAAKELRNYLNKNDSGGVSEQLVTGLDFSYRLVRTKGDRQIWLYGETVHGARSGDVDCDDEDNEDTDLCKVARFESPTPQAQFAIFRKATTLEGFMGIRADLVTLREESTSSSKFYLKGQLGFLTTAQNGGDLVDMHHVGVGLTLTEGLFAGSYFELGYGRNDLFRSKNPVRARIDGFLSIAPQGENSKGRPFMEIVVEPDFRSGPDNIQIFMGLDINILELFK
jgi:hypothetical protein